MQIGELLVDYVPSEEQMEDIMTKSLHTTQFEDLKIKLIVLENP